MGSTFWVELYFRSLKRVRVLTLLSKYLLQYKKVCIPHVGTFEIIHQPPTLDLGDQVILPPVYSARLVNNNQVPEHQFHYFVSNGVSREDIPQVLSSFGERLRHRIQNGPFYWKGLGTLQLSSNEVFFSADTIRIDALQPVSAQKVLRQNVQHQVLVGDQEMTSHQITQVLNRAPVARSWYIPVAWVLLVVGVIAILVLLYLKHFSTASTGLQTKW